MMLRITRMFWNCFHLFVDDLFIFSLATSSEVVIIKTYLDKYSSWSGQTVNSHKSNISFSKIQLLLPYQPSSLFSPTIILLPLPNIWDSLFRLVNPKQRLSLTFWKKFKGKLKDDAPKLYLRLVKQSWLKLFLLFFLML